MYDRDLRIWYRDLFLRTARRRPGRIGQASGVLRASTGPLPDGVEPAGLLQDLQALRNHERPQATS